MKSIIFGISGQDGFYLTQILERDDVQVIGVSRTDGKWVRADVSDFDAVQQLISVHRPDYVFHLAANSTTRHSALFENHETICTGSLNILESVRLHCPEAKVFLSGSAMQFKNDGRPIDESTSFAARSPYAISRIHSVYYARYYRDVFGIRVYIGYFFNHDSPRRSENHINQRIVRAVQRIGLGSNELIYIGDMNAKKEFSFAGDSMEAVWKLINQDSIFEVVIGSGIVHSIRDWVISCFETIGKNWEEYVVIRKDFKSEYEILISNPALMKSIGWEPRVNFYDLRDLMMLNK